MFRCVQIYSPCCRLNLNENVIDNPNTGNVSFAIQPHFLPPPYIFISLCHHCRGNFRMHHLSSRIINNHTLLICHSIFVSFSPSVFQWFLDPNQTASEITTNSSAYSTSCRPQVPPPPGLNAAKLHVWKTRSYKFLLIDCWFSCGWDNFSCAVMHILIH